MAERQTDRMVTNSGHVVKTFKHVETRGILTFLMGIPAMDIN